MAREITRLYMETEEQKKAIESILDERYRQDKKWGSQRNLSDDRWLTILTEEVGESAESILEKDIDNLELEVTQVAAVALAWLEALICRREQKKREKGVEELMTKEEHANPS